MRLCSGVRTLTRRAGTRGYAQAQVEHPKSAAGAPAVAHGTVKLTTLPTNLAVTTSSAVLPAVGLVWKIPAGSRYETPSTTGLSHYLRQALFAGNEKESGLALARRAELRGTNLSITNDRESITIAADCPHEEATRMLESVSTMLLHFKIKHHQHAEIEARVALDRELADADVETQLWDHAFGAAYRTGLGNSLLRSGIHCAPGEHVNAFLAAAMKRSGHVVAASGLAHLELSEPLKSLFAAAVPKLQLVEATSRYYGGERRVEHAGDGRNHVLLAFGTGGAHNKGESHAVRILAALIGSGETVQYGNSQSHLDGIRELLAKHPDLSITADFRQYSDGGLLGVKVSAPLDFDVKPVLEGLCRELKALANGAAKAEALVAAKSRAAFEAVSELDTRIGHAGAMASNVLTYNAPLNIQADLSALQGASSAEFKGMAAKILSRKPVVVSMGRLATLPHADELSF